MSFIPWWTLYPYVNDEAINLDWLLSKVTRDGEKLDDFITINSIKYADPILWDITSQYEANTITVDPQTGDAYISTTAVPYGTALSNTDYWTKIYNYADAVNTLMEQIAIANERLSTTASDTRSIGDLVWLNGQLYEVIAAMIAGDTYVENSNCIKTTIEEYINTRITAINQTLAYMGNLANLNTIDKSTLVAAINEVLTTLANGDNAINNKIGSLANLNTRDKDNIVDAINEVKNDLNTYKRILIGDSYNVESVVNPTWGNLVSNYLGNCVSFGYGARGFASQYTFYDSFSADLSSITDKESVKEVIVCGGANDVGQSFADIKTAISNFNTLITTNFVNAKLKIGFIGWSRNAITIWNTTYKYYKKACEELGIEYLNGVEVPMHNTSFLQTSVDNIHHPNTDGSNALAHAITNAIITGDANYEDSGQIIITQSGTHLIPTAGQKIWYSVKNGLLTLKSDLIVYGNTGGTDAGVTSLINNTLAEIGTIGDGYLKNLEIAETLHSFTLSSFLYDGTKSVPVNVVIWGDGHIGIKQTSGADITNGFGGYISGFTITMPVCELA